MPAILTKLAGKIYIIIIFIINIFIIIITIIIIVVIFITVIILMCNFTDFNNLSLIILDKFDVDTQNLLKGDCQNRMRCEASFEIYTKSLIISVIVKGTMICSGGGGGGHSPHDWLRTRVQRKCFFYVTK